MKFIFFFLLIFFISNLLADSNFKCPLKFGNFPNFNNPCKTYWECKNDVPVLKTCFWILEFSPDAGRCLNPNVAKCNETLFSTSGGLTKSNESLDTSLLKKFKNYEDSTSSTMLTSTLMSSTLISETFVSSTGASTTLAPENISSSTAASATLASKALVSSTGASTTLAPEKISSSTTASTTSASENLVSSTGASTTLEPETISISTAASTSLASEAISSSAAASTNLASEAISSSTAAPITLAFTTVAPTASSSLILTSTTPSSSTLTPIGKSIATVLSTNPEILKENLTVTSSLNVESPFDEVDDLTNQSSNSSHSSVVINSKNLNKSLKFFSTNTSTTHDADAKVRTEVTSNVSEQPIVKAFAFTVKPPLKENSTSQAESNDLNSSFEILKTNENGLTVKTLFFSNSNVTPSTKPAPKVNLVSSNKTKIFFNNEDEMVIEDLGHDVHENDQGIMIKSEKRSKKKENEKIKVKETKVLKPDTLEKKKLILNFENDPIVKLVNTLTSYQPLLESSQSENSSTVNLRLTDDETIKPVENDSESKFEKSSKTFDSPLIPQPSISLSISSVESNVVIAAKPGTKKNIIFHSSTPSTVNPKISSSSFSDSSSFKPKIASINKEVEPSILNIDLFKINHDSSNDSSSTKPEHTFEVVTIVKKNDLKTNNVDESKIDKMINVTDYEKKVSSPPPSSNSSLPELEMSSAHPKKMIVIPLFFKPKIIEFPKELKIEKEICCKMTSTPPSTTTLTESNAEPNDYKVKHSLSNNELKSDLLSSETSSPSSLLPSNQVPSTTTYSAIVNINEELHHSKRIETPKTKVSNHDYISSDSFTSETQTTTVSFNSSNSFTNANTTTFIKSDLDKNVVSELSIEQPKVETTSQPATDSANVNSSFTQVKQTQTKKTENINAVPESNFESEKLLDNLSSGLVKLINASNLPNVSKKITAIAENAFHDVKNILEKFNNLLNQSNTQVNLTTPNLPSSPFTSSSISLNKKTELKTASSESTKPNSNSENKASLKTKDQETLIKKRTELDSTFFDKRKVNLSKSESNRAVFPKQAIELIDDVSLKNKIKNSYETSSTESVTILEKVESKELEKNTETDSKHNKNEFFCSKDGAFKNSLNCTQFILCSSGKAIVSTCPLGLGWNSQFSTCDLLKRSDCNITH